MTPVPMGPVAREAYDQVAPLGPQDEAHGHVLAHLNAVLTAPIEDVALWISDGENDEPGYSVLLDIDTAPDTALRWLGQMKGVVVTAGISAAEQREQIRGAAGMFRGSAGALRIAARGTLSVPDPTILVLTRVGGDMYAVTVITRTAETPDPDATLAALMRAKRIGVILTHVATDDVVWAEATVTWTDVDPSVTWATVELADVT